MELMLNGLEIAVLRKKAWLLQGATKTVEASKDQVSWGVAALRRRFRSIASRSSISLAVLRRNSRRGGLTVRNEQRADRFQTKDGTLRAL